MREYCHCGIPKNDHMIMEPIVDKIDDAFNHVARMQTQFAKQLIIYGNICTDYRRDNLRYLEEVSNNGR